MNPQTDSHTEVREFDADDKTFVKAKDKGEPTFSLRSQDISAPVVVKFWIKAQQRIAASLDVGLTLEQAVVALEGFYFLDALDHDTLTPKQAGALVIAEAMEKHPERKLAD